jgi:hypothetical protein
LLESNHYWENKTRSLFHVAVAEARKRSLPSRASAVTASTAAVARRGQATDYVLTERLACDIRIRTERKAGQLLHDMEKAKGAAGNPGGRGAPIVRSDDATTQTTLADLGISKMQ